MPTIKPPRSLSKEAKAFWRDIVAENSHLGAADKPLLLLLCRLMVQLDRALQDIEGGSLYATSQKGSEYTHPATNIIFGLTDKITKLSRELKISFSTRPEKASQKPDLRPFRRAQA